MIKLCHTLVTPKSHSCHAIETETDTESDTDNIKDVVVVEVKKKSTLKEKLSKR